MNKEIRKALDQLDTALAAGGDDARAIWDVLSALRGPDQDYVLLNDPSPTTVNDAPLKKAGYYAKTATTAFIRAVALPKTAKAITAGIVDLPATFANADHPDNANLARLRQGLIPSHFCRHARNGFAVLGLKWDGVNDGKFLNDRKRAPRK